LISFKEKNKSIKSIPKIKNNDNITIGAYLKQNNNKLCPINNNDEYYENIYNNLLSYELNITYDKISKK